MEDKYIETHSEKLKAVRDYLYNLQWQFENTKPSDNCLDQSIRLSQRIRTLLNIYSQVLDGREFDEEYLKNYL